MKKALSLFLIFVMIFSLLPLSALAAEEDVQTETEQSLETEGSVGTLLSNTLDGAGVMNDEPSACSVTGISVEGKTATVDYQTDRASELVVAIYEEDTNKMLGSGHTIVSADADMATVTIEIDSMPAYFTASAYLLEAETLVPLCDAFTSTYYTQEVSDLRQKTAEDFEEERVLLLEEGNTETNFLVFSEDTLVAEQTGDANQITDNGDGTYTITNADESFQNLKEGDSFSYTYADGTVLVVVAKSVRASGTTVTVTADTDAELADMFDYVKIEATSDGAEPVVDTSTMGDGITYLGCDENTTVPMDGALIDEKASISHEINYGLDVKLYESADKTKSVTIKGTFQMAIKASLELYITLKYQYVDFTLKESDAFSVTVSGKVTACEKSLAKIDVPLLEGVVSFRLEPKLVLEFSGSVSLSIEQSTSYGWVYDSNNGGITDKSSEPNTKSKLEFKGEVFLGVKLKVSVVVGNDVLEKVFGEEIAELYFSATAGLKISMAEDLLEDREDMRHECYVCYDGEIKAVLELEFGLKILKVGNINRKIVPVEKKICDVYCSWGFSEFDTHMEFGFTTCPHKSYKLTVNAVDPDGEAVAAAVKIADKSTGQTLKFKDGVIDSKGSESLTTTNGKAEVFLPNGKYTVTLSYNGETKTKDITVHNKATETRFKLTTSTGDETITGPTEADGKIIDSGTCGENVKWSFYESGLLYIYGTGEMEDYFFLGSEPWYSECSRIKSVVIDNGVTSIGDCAFFDYNFSYGALVSVTIPDSVTKVGKEVFCYCSALERISVSESNSVYSSEEGVLFSEDKTKLICYPAGKKDKSYTIPAGVENIGECAFHNCTSLTSVTIPSGVTRVEDMAFDHCTSLESIVFPDSVESLGWSVFNACELLTKVVIQEGVKTIDVQCFSFCNALESIMIPSSVTSIGRAAFRECNSLANIYYLGTESQWSAITIDSTHSFNAPLTSATIHYNYNPTTTVAMDEAVRPVEGATTEETTTEEVTEETTEEGTEEVTEETTTEEVTTEETTEETTTEETTTTETTEETTTEEGTIELVAAYTGVLSEANGQKLAGFTDLVPSARHVLLVMKDAKASDPLAASNLLYIMQGKSTATGTLSLVYVPCETVSNPAAVVYGPDKVEFSGLLIQVGKKPVDIVAVKVTFNGSVLTEGVDYTFTSSTGANGVISVTVTGKGAYTGTAAATLSREPGDMDGNGKTNIMDVLVLLKSVAGITAMPEHGDVNADGTTNIMDVLALLKYVAGIAGSVVY